MFLRRAFPSQSLYILPKSATACVEFSGNAASKNLKRTTPRSQGNLRLKLFPGLGLESFILYSFVVFGLLLCSYDN